MTGHSRVVVHDVPVTVVPRRLWAELAEPSMPEFAVRILFIPVVWHEILVLNGEAFYLFTPSILWSILRSSVVIRHVLFQKFPITQLVL